MLIFLRVICCRLSGICKHVAALLYRISDIAHDGLNKPGTSRQQTWHQPSKLSKSAFVRDICTPKASPSMSVERKPRRDEYDPRPKELQLERTLDSFDLDELAEISNGTSALLLYAAPYRNQAPSGTEPNINVVYQEEEVVTTKEISALSVPEAIHQHLPLTVSTDARNWVVENTTEQSNSSLWFKYREGRITSSNVGQVLCHVTEDGQLRGSIHSIVANIMGYYNKDVPSNALPPPLKWGRQMESQGLKLYKKLQSTVHHKLKVKTTGLWISTSHPYLAASPDGLRDCECCIHTTAELTLCLSRHVYRLRTELVGIKSR